MSVNRSIIREVQKELRKQALEDSEKEKKQELILLIEESKKHTEYKGRCYFYNKELLNELKNSEEWGPRFIINEIIAIMKESSDISSLEKSLKVMKLINTIKEWHKQATLENQIEIIERVIITEETKNAKAHNLMAAIFVAAIPKLKGVLFTEDTPLKFDVEANPKEFRRILVSHF